MAQVQYYGVITSYSIHYTKLYEGGSQHEGKTFCKAYLRKMQSHSSQRPRHGDL